MHYDTPEYDKIRAWVGRGQSEELLGTWAHPYFGTGAQGESHWIGSASLIGIKQPDGSRMAINIDIHRAHDGYREIVAKFDALKAKYFPERKKLVRRGGTPTGTDAQPQMQNIPLHTEEAQQVRAAFSGTTNKGPAAFDLFAEAGRVAREEKEKQAAYVCASCGEEDVHSMTEPCPKCGSRQIVTKTFAKQHFGADWKATCFGPKEPAPEQPRKLVKRSRT